LGYRSPDEYETEYESEHDGGPSGAKKDLFGVRQCGAVAELYVVSTSEAVANSSKLPVALPVSPW